MGQVVKLAGIAMTTGKTCRLYDRTHTILLYNEQKMFNVH